MKRYILLKGSHDYTPGNIGDKLVFEASKSLLNRYCKINNYKVYHIKDNLDKIIQDINESKAVILCGGPILGSKKRESFYPNYVRFTKNLADIKVPIIPLGIGLFPSLSDLLTPQSDYFDNSSSYALNFIHDRIKMSSVRDYPTKIFLNNLGISNVIVTGCPVLYFPTFSNANFEYENINSIAVSIGAGHSSSEENIRNLNQKLLRTISNKFKNYNLYCTLHHGNRSYRKFNSSEAKKLGYTIKELGENNTDYLRKFYNKVDLHIGFRIHAHIWFLIHGKPSFLIWEDGRGKAFSDTFKLENDISCKKSNFDTKIIENVEKELRNNFLSFKKFNNLYNEYFYNMKEFLETIP